MTAPFPAPTEQKLIEQLLAADQGHLFDDWDEPGTNDEAKADFLAILRRIDGSYPGGLTGYIANARTLLGQARAGDNPFEGFVPHQPVTVDLTHLDDAYDRYEALGKAQFERVGFVLVAGGLGERLGYSGIKLDIPIEVTETTPYLAHYAACLLAMESRMDAPRPVPLIIMTSEDTNSKTLASLETHDWFGLQREQVHILKQELVPAITDNEGHLALKQKYQIVLKPHGHGDIHMLLHSSGIAARLQAQGIEHLVFIQDTNGQVFNAVPAALGVSVDSGFDFNSLAVNRVPGEAVGALTRLVGKDEELTINVEYNQLDPLLRATVSPEGDVPNDQGFSLFPGNINVLVIKLDSYTRILERTQGIVAEFVNPKYADAERTRFKKPTRLETMMQDLPKLFGPNERVGVSIFDRRWCFSAIKNNVTDAAAKHAAGGPPESGATAESDFYRAGRTRVANAGMVVEEAAETLIQDIPVTPGPRVVLRPAFALTLQEAREKIFGGSISDGATLVLDGKDIRLENVTITDGAALVIRASQGARVVVRNLRIENAGFEIVPLTDSEMTSTETPEYLRIRGYRIEDCGAAIYSFTESGEYVLDATGAQPPSSR